MIGHSHWLTRRRIERLFAHGLSPDAYVRLRAELGGCEHCAEVYRAHHLLESALCGVETWDNPFSHERVGAAVVAPAAKSSGPRIPRWTWPAAAVATATALALLFVPPRSERMSLAGAQLSPVLASRGAEYSSASGIGIRVFRVTAQPEEAGARPLMLADTIAFTYTNTHLAAGWLSLLGVQAGGEVHWYYPDRHGARSVAIDADVVDEPLSSGILLSVNHHPGWLRVVGVFSPEPLTMAEVQQAVADKGDDALVGLESLSIPNTWEHSLLLEVESE